VHGADLCRNPLRQPPISVRDVDVRSVAFLPRHNINHSIPPHKVNYRANIYVLKEIGVKRILATNTVGAINLNFKPGNLVVPYDFVDFTKLRKFSFYDDAPVTHMDMSQPFSLKFGGCWILLGEAGRKGVEESCFCM
jgi:5'-methylthioadenosine phosphorylase